MNKNQLLQELKSEGFSEIILKAFEKVKREEFIPKHLKEYAYRNEPLPIGEGSTISQPYTIAFMLNLLELDRLTNEEILVTNNINMRDKSSKQEKGKFSYQEKLISSKNQKYDITNEITNKNKIKILEIGSGSGYVLALINEIMKTLKIKNTKKLSVFGSQKIKDFSSYEIYGVEINNELVNSSSSLFKKNKKIKVICGDGSKGFPEEKPFERILVSAAFEKMPENLFSQLKDNGILVTPVRNSIFQIKKINNKIQEKEFPGFVFVPVIE